MERLFTLKNSLTNVEIQEENNAPATELLEPSNESIDFLLNFSKALKASSTKSIGDVFTVLN